VLVLAFGFFPSVNRTSSKGYGSGSVVSVVYWPPGSGSANSELQIREGLDPVSDLDHYYLSRFKEI
jgi:hypothetical protein